MPVRRASPLTNFFHDELDRALMHSLSLFAIPGAAPGILIKLLPICEDHRLPKNWTFTFPAMVQSEKYRRDFNCPEWRDDEIASDSNMISLGFNPSAPAH